MIQKEPPFFIWWLTSRVNIISLESSIVISYTPWKVNILSPKVEVWKMVLFRGVWLMWLMIQASGQIAIIPKPALRAFWGGSHTKPHFGVTNRRVAGYNLPETWYASRYFFCPKCPNMLAN